MRRWLFQACLVGLVLVSVSGYGEAAPKKVVCVEKVWCDLATQIGDNMIVSHILIKARDLDPHHIQSSPSMARSLIQADVVLANGATYDDWALPFQSGHATYIVAAKEAQWHVGEDPHLFFDFQAVHAFVQKLAWWLEQQEPSQKEAVQARLEHFEASLQQLKAYSEALRQRGHAVPIAITEPAGERLLEQTGLVIINKRWALATMAGNGASAQDTALLEEAITQRKIRFLVVNPAVMGGAVRNVRLLAQQHQLPVVEIGETLPEGLSWQEWMIHILDEVARYLPEKGSSQ